MPACVLWNQTDKLTKTCTPGPCFDSSQLLSDICLNYFTYKLSLPILNHYWNQPIHAIMVLISHTFKLFVPWEIFHAFLSSAVYFKKKLFPKIFSGKPSECQTVWIQIRPDICRA